MLSNKRKPEMEWKGGRLILHGQAYSRMRARLAELAGYLCEVPESDEDGPCGRYTPLNAGEVHHLFGRGGGRRDDRIEIGGKRNLLWACKSCHRGVHEPKVVPPKVKLSDDEFDKLIGLEAQQ